MSQFSLSKMVSALSFAHLAGLPVKATRARAGNDDPEDKKSEDDNPTNEKNGRRAQREDESDDEYADYNDEQEENDDDETAKEGDEKDDDEDEMRGKSAAASARRRERARCAAIMGSKHAANNVVLAANLAFKTTMTRNQALTVLRETPAAAAVESRNSDRTARRNPSLGAGGEQTQSPKAAVESSWDRAYSRVIKSR